MKERVTYVSTEPGVDVPDDCWIEILGDTRTPIAILPCGSIYDANLIAAAPDMLEVLQIIFNRVMYESPTAEIGAIFDAVMIERVEDVLNKAKGGR